MRYLFLLGLITVSLGLYEDQIGRFDWRKQFVGCPRQAFFHKSDKTEQLIVATKQNVFSSLSTANGELNWRRIEEDSPVPFQITLAGSKRLYTVSNGGRLLRAWNAATGAILWQKTVSETESSDAQLAVPIEASQGVFVLSAGALHQFSTSGDQIWKLDVGSAAWSRLAVSGANEVRLVTLENEVLTVKVISEGKVAKTMTVAVKGSTEKCIFIGSHLACFHSDEVVSVNVVSSSLTAESLIVGISIRELVILGPDHLAARSQSGTIVLSLGPLKNVFKLDRKVETAALAENKFVALGEGHFHVVDLATGKEIFSKSIGSASAAATQLYARAQKNSLELFVVFSDCRTEFFDLALATQSLELEWHKEEALARVVAVEMIDLPLSESQQLIEDEFDETGGNIISAFLHRTISQLIQVQRWFVHTVQQIMTLSETVTTKDSFSQLLSSVKSTSRPNRLDETLEARNHAFSSKQPLERDYFNLRKMLVVVSLDGVVFGIDSSDGTIVWRTSLGATFSPLTNSLGEQKIGLFIQRSTSNYHLHGQAVVAFKDSFTEKGVLVAFNPITGTIIERKSLENAVSRVDLLPFTDKDQLHSLVLVDPSEKVTFYPELPADFEVPHPVFILGTSASNLAGKQVNFKTRRLETVWTANIHLGADEKIIVVKGKPSNQRVHSQGRVLIDRTVQYKYSNPNLVAVATLDSSSQLLTIYLVDVVSGLIVHTAKLPRASGPIHLVHCENWVAYSYWSEKSRRTEIGVVELYEGETQESKDKFDSLSPSSKAPEVTTQSYVYAQGVDAMAVSETEQGLTTRSIVLALPFGGLHEVSRKLLDANRPYELTQEMREEGMIPYMPELPIATEEMINYNQTVFRVRGIKTAPSGLESTSLMLAYGMDIFFTRLHPSGTFDILKDDFDHVLISLVLAGLFIGSFISKRISRNNALRASWA